MRVVAFGCSFTFGAGLPDIYTKNPTRDTKPSSLAWPNILAKMLDCECVNNGKPAIGNLEIFNKVINFKFQPDDICVILWSEFSRHDKFLLDTPSLGKSMNDKWFVENHSIDKHWYIVNNKARNWLTMQHTHLWLSYKKIKNYSILGIIGYDTLPIPNIDIPNLDRDITPPSWIIDAALDRDDPGQGGGHPGVESHKKLAEIFYNKLLEHVLY